MREMRPACVGGKAQVVDCGVWMLVEILCVTTRQLNQGFPALPRYRQEVEGPSERIFDRDGQGRFFENQVGIRPAEPKGTQAGQARPLARFPGTIRIRHGDRQRVPANSGVSWRRMQAGWNLPMLE